jgi:hypothetical protein
MRRRATAASPTPETEPAAMTRPQRHARAVSPPAPRRVVARAEAWTTHLAILLVGGTGLVYAWMTYFLPPADPYAIVNHPWQPHLQHLHVVTAPLLVFAAGLLWRRHVWASWKLGVRERRRSGIGLALTVAPMVVSGYLIQTAVGETWRQVWVAVHLAASALWIAGYLAHQLGRRGSTS